MKKAAIITGASRGIGRATAIELSRRGFDVMLASRLEQELRGVADAVAGNAEIAVGDVVLPGWLATTVQRTIDRFGRLDAIVNNAGLAPMLPVAQTDEWLFDDVIAVNLSAAFALCRNAWPHLKKQGGTIVNVSSLAAVDPFAGFSAYAAAKAGLEGLTRALAKEGAEHGIRAVAVAPGGVETAMFRALPGMADVPGESLLSPDDVASVIADCITSPLRHASGETIRLRK